MVTAKAGHHLFLQRPALRDAAEGSDGQDSFRGAQADEGCDRPRAEEGADPAGAQSKGRGLQDDSLPRVADVFLHMRAIHKADERGKGRRALDLAVVAHSAPEDLLRGGFTRTARASANGRNSSQTLFSSLSWAASSGRGSYRLRDRRKAMAAYQRATATPCLTPFDTNRGISTPGEKILECQRLLVKERTAGRKRLPTV
ncbi:MAG: hypothetical protein QMC81_04930 [Thermoanaerobacterales bacterium]|nr:hypothetical protein [Thermoanaerobacterales bacterium]